MCVCVYCCWRAEDAFEDEYSLLEMKARKMTSCKRKTSKQAGEERGREASGRSLLSPLLRIWKASHDVLLREMVDPSWKLPSQQLTKSAVWPGKPNYDTHSGPWPFMSDWKQVGDSRWQSRSSRCSQENVCWDLNPCRASTGGWNSQESIAGPG